MKAEVVKRSGRHLWHVKYYDDTGYLTHITYHDTEESAYRAAHSWTQNGRRK